MVPEVHHSHDAKGVWRWQNCVLGWEQEVDLSGERYMASQEGKWWGLGTILGQKEIIADAKLKLVLHVLL